MENLILYLAVLGGLAYTAVLYGSEDLLLLVFGGIGWMGISYLYLAIQLFFIKVRLTLPISMVEQGGETELLLEISNRGILPAPKLKICLGCKNRSSKKRTRQTVRGQAAVQSRTMLYCPIVGKHCGCCEYRLKRIRIYDPTGLFYLTKWSRQRVEMQVLPRIFGTVVQVTERARNFIGEAEVYDDRKAGPDVSEVFALRPFRDGDRIQNIHWKLSAKEEELIVRENSLPLGCSVVLLLDLLGRVEETDGVLTVAAAISCALVEQKCAHYIAWYDRQERDIVRMRIYQEEELYLFFLQLYMEDTGKMRGTKGRGQKISGGIEKIAELYREKYRMELAPSEISVSRKLEIKSGEEIQFKIDRRRMEQALSEVEFVV